MSTRICKRLVIGTIAMIVYIAGYEEANGQRLTIDQIKSEIAHANPELKMYESQAMMLDTYARGANAWEPMQIGAGFFMTPYNTTYWNTQKIKDNMGGDAEMPAMGSMMIQALQMIPNPAKQKANRTYMQSMSAVENAARSTAHNDLIYRAEESYYKILIAQKKLQIIYKLIDLIQESINIGEKKVTYRQETLANIYKAKAQAASLENEKYLTNTDIETQKIILNTLMNRNRMQELELDTAFEIKNYDSLPIDTMKIIENHSELKALAANMNIASKKINLEKSKLKPDFGLQFGHMIAFGNNPNSFTLMGMMSIPILPWSSRMYTAAAEGLTYQQKAYEQQSQKYKIETLGMLQQLILEIGNKKRQLALFDNVILPAMNASQEVSYIAYFENTGSLTSFLEAAENTQTALLQRLDLLRDLLLLQSSYEKQAQIY